MASFADTEERLRMILATAEGSVRRMFERLIDRLKDDIGTLDEIADLLASGQLSQALEIGTRAAGGLASEVLGAAYIPAAQSTADFLADSLKVTIDFDQTNFRAVNRMSAARLNLIREFTNSQRDATREALVDGIQRGINPRAQARAFRNAIGLTQHQVRSVNNFRRLLQENDSAALTRRLRDRRFDRTIRTAIRNDTPLGAEQIDRMVGRYRERFLKFRAETIARTEALRSVHEGHEDMMQQAFDEGVVDPEQVQRKWVTAGDERVRESHSALNGQLRAPGEVWQGFEGALRFPGDPFAPPAETISCRCVLTTRLTSI